MGTDTFCATTGTNMMLIASLYNIIGRMMKAISSGSRISEYPTTSDVESSTRLKSCENEGAPSGCLFITLCHMGTKFAYIGGTSHAMLCATQSTNRMCHGRNLGRISTMPDIDSYNDLVKAGWSLSSPRSRPCQYAVRNHFEQKPADQHREGGQITIARRRTCGGVFQLAKKVPLPQNIPGKNCMQAHNHDCWWLITHHGIDLSVPRSLARFVPSRGYVCMSVLWVSTFSGRSLRPCSISPV
jgi:hypothetical protein